MPRTIFQNLVTIAEQNNVYALVFSDRLGTHRVYLLDQPQIIAHEHDKDYTDYPAAWDWWEAVTYGAGNVEVTITFSDGRYMDGPEATVTVEAVDRTPAAIPF